MKAGLYLVSTPIGNLKDITLRALEVLSSADIIACEDTRTTKQLLRLLEIKAQTEQKFISCHNFNEEEKVSLLIEKIKEGHTVALVSDAGTPLISDPGYKIAAECARQGIYVTPVPGANALLPALQLSGLPSDRFLFNGFLPAKQQAAEEELKSLTTIPATLIFYESPIRILKTLRLMRQVFGNRQASVVREITKMFEETLSGSLDFLIRTLENREKIKGECVILVNRAGKEGKTDDDIKKMLREALESHSLKEAVSLVQKESGRKKQDVYKKALEIKDGTPSD